MLLQVVTYEASEQYHYNSFTSAEFEDFLTSKGIKHKHYLQIMSSRFLLGYSITNHAASGHATLLDIDEQTIPYTIHSHET